MLQDRIAEQPGTNEEISLLVTNLKITGLSETNFTQSKAGPDEAAFNFNLFSLADEMCPITEKIKKQIREGLTLQILKFNKLESLSKISFFFVSAEKRVPIFKVF